MASPEADESAELAPEDTGVAAEMDRGADDSAELAPQAHDDVAPVAAEAPATLDLPADPAPVTGEDTMAAQTPEPTPTPASDAAQAPLLEPPTLEIGPLAALTRAEDTGADPVADDAPVAPAQDVMPAPADLPVIRRPERAERESALPEMLPPSPSAPQPNSVQADPPRSVAEEAPQRGTLAQDRVTMPGRPVPGLVRIDTDPFLPGSAQDLPEAPQQTALTALERNSLYAGGDTGAARMALVLNDPGLPTPLRRDLAALDFPFTIALNPLDSSAQAAAEIYTAGGKEVVILAAGLPVGATASDIDVSLTSYLEMLPQAVGMIDLPDEGFARNAQLLRAILPYLAQDGHGLITFAGGLTQASAAAQSAGVAHAEIFRVLDDGEQSPFTIRRFLDRAVFQASQMGHVIVFGDAANETTLEAITMWREDGRVGQISLTPVSAILLAQD